MRVQHTLDGHTSSVDGEGWLGSVGALALVIRNALCAKGGPQLWVATDALVTMAQLYIDVPASAAPGERRAAFWLFWGARCAVLDVCAKADVLRFCSADVVRWRERRTR